MALLGVKLGESLELVEGAGVDIPKRAEVRSCPFPKWRDTFVSGVVFFQFPEHRPKATTSGNLEKEKKPKHNNENNIRCRGRALRLRPVNLGAFGDVDPGRLYQHERFAQFDAQERHDAEWRLRH